MLYTILFLIDVLFSIIITATITIDAFYTSFSFISIHFTLILVVLIYTICYSAFGFLSTTIRFVSRKRLFTQKIRYYITTVIILLILIIPGLFSLIYQDHQTEGILLIIIAIGQLFFVANLLTNTSSLIKKSYISIILPIRICFAISAYIGVLSI